MITINSRFFKGTKVPGRDLWVVEERGKKRRRLQRHGAVFERLTPRKERDLPGFDDGNQ